MRCYELPDVWKPVSTDPHLRSIHGHPQFMALLTELRREHDVFRAKIGPPDDRAIPGLQAAYSVGCQTNALGSSSMADLMPPRGRLAGGSGHNFVNAVLFGPLGGRGPYRPAQL